jgi:cobalt-zinc-cadmium resistance protein CzcA
VTEINTIGGYAKEYQVAPARAPGRLRHDAGGRRHALERNNANVGAGYIERRGEQYLIRAPGQVVHRRHRQTSLGTEGACRPHRDVAEVELGRELRTGAATDNGREVVLGTVFMLIGENSRTVSQAVDKKMEEINKNLPAGVHAVTSTTAPRWWTRPSPR